MSRILILCAIISLISYIECNPEAVNVNFLYKSSVVLDCTSSGWDAEKIEFYRVLMTDEGEEVENKLENFVNENGVQKVEIKGTTATLNDLRREDIIKSTYFCKSTESDDKLHFVKQIEPSLMHPDKESQTVTEGGFAEFKCEILYGNENDSEITWVWTRNDTAIEDSDNFKVESDQSQSKLTISNVEESHRGMLSCTATNKFGSHSNEFQLRVKNTLAALWPFLGIVAEVLVLCVIILIYEKKCNKKPHNSGEDNEQSENLMGKESHGDLKKRNPKA